MSGGYFDYKYVNMDDYIEEMDDFIIKELLDDTRELLYDFEWFKSGDTNEDRWEKQKLDFKLKWLSGLGEETIKQTLLKYCGYMDKFCDQLKKDIDKGK